MLAVHLPVGAGGVFRCGQEVTTILGSCVSVVLHSLELGVGGMLHAFLPGRDGRGANGTTNKQDKPCWFVDEGIDYLLDALARSGAHHSQLRAKVFGGANCFVGNSLAVGSQNAERALNILEGLGIPVLAQDIGGEHGRKLVYVVASGNVLMRRLK